MLNASFLDFIKKERLFEKEENLLLAISGGLDSVVLAHLLKKNGFQFSLAHMNFQLRGIDSNDDEKFVEKLANRLGVRVFTKKVIIKEQDGSTQIQARKLRYDWFKELVQEYSFAKLLTAHHADDLLETALFNLIRGAGIRGIRSILPIHDNIARPLLFAEKQDLQQYAKDHNINWREDISNASDHYTRNKIRHHIVPQLISLNPNLLSGFQQTTLRLRAAEEAWEEKLVNISKKYFSYVGSHLKIDKSILENDNVVVHLSELLAGHGFTLPQLQAFNFGRVGAQLFTSTHLLTVDRSHLLISEVSHTNRKAFFPKKVDLNMKSVSTPLGNFKFDFIRREDLNFDCKPNTVFIDFNSLKEPLEIDLWNEGDRIQPIGMKGKKKISDILIDQKVSLPKKQEALVLKSNAKIVWVAGYKFSELFKVKKSSSKILRIIYDENIESI